MTTTTPSNPVIVDVIPPSAGFASTKTIGLAGLQGHVVDVEAHLTPGLPACRITGLADTAVAEARDRVHAAVTNSGARWPTHRITIGLGPAWLPKHGSMFDLAMAIVVLAASGQVPTEAPRQFAVLGELALSSHLRPVRGLLPAVLAAREAGIGRVMVPRSQLAEAQLVAGVEAIGVDDLGEAIGIFCGTSGPRPAPQPPDPTATPHRNHRCLSTVAGQVQGKFALEIAAAGGHHLLYIGPPGAGKTLLAQCLPGLLPALTDEQALQVAAIHSLAGTTPAQLNKQPPLQAPHHSATMPALVGGGSGTPRPGAASLAHNGVLFLDEATEFSHRALDGLREPLEHGEVELTRSGGTARYPATFQLVMAANPCPCVAPTDASCTCAPGVRRRYLSRLSGPLLDRVDLHVTLPGLTPAELLAAEPGATSHEVAKRVAQARQAARQRWRDWPWELNCAASGDALRRVFTVNPNARRPLDAALARGALTARGYDRALRVAWTLADLAGRDKPNGDDIETATALRTGVAR